MIRRREFIAVFGGAAAAWPLAAQTQQGERMRRIGVLALGGESAPQTQARLNAFKKGLETLGWIEGRNIRIDYRYTSGEAESTRVAAAEIVALGPEVVLSNPPGLPALQQATHTIPVVFAVLLDPVGQGVVANLARPGGNMTGFAAFDPSNNTKYLELLKQIAPGVARVAFMHDPRNAGTNSWPDALAAAGPLFNLDIYDTPVRDAGEAEQSIDAFARQPNGALLMANNVPIVSNLQMILSLAMRHHLPTMGFFRYFPDNGALMSYGFDDIDQFRQAASYVDLILKGAKPADLPVQYPTKYELVINLKTAKALGLTVSQTLLVAADDVIE